MTEQIERSGFIFTLAEELGLPIKPGALEPISDLCYLEYRTRYNELARKRDEALFQHLDSEMRFRTFIPHKERAYQLAYHVLWYLDEVIVKDPLGFLLGGTKPPSDLEKAKESLVHALQVMYKFKQSIDSGYLLLGGRNVIPFPNAEIPQEISELALQPDIIRELDAAVRYHCEKRFADGQIWIFARYLLDYASYFQCQCNGPIKGPPPFVPGETYPRCSISAMAQMTGNSEEEIIKMSRAMYAKEIQNILFNAGVAKMLNSSALFDRKVEARILDLSMNRQLDLSRQSNSIGSLNLALPYIDNIPPEYLMDLRQSMPRAFIEFRASMLDIVQTAKKNHPENASEWAQSEAERRIVPTLRHMEADMKAISTKLHILGVGLPTTIGMGLFAAQHVQPGSWDLVGLIAGSAAYGLTQLAEVLGSKKKLGSDRPFAFLWHARPR